MVVAAVAPWSKTAPVDVIVLAPPVKLISSAVTVRLATVAPAKATVPAVPPIKVRFCPPKALTRVRLAPAGTAPLFVVSIVLAAVKVTVPRLTTPPAVLTKPAPKPADWVVAVNPPVNTDTSLAASPIVSCPVLANVVLPAMELLLPVINIS